MKCPVSYIAGPAFVVSKPKTEGGGREAKRESAIPYRGDLVFNKK